MKQVGIDGNNFTINKITGACVLLPQNKNKTPLLKITDAIYDSGMVDDVTATDTEIIIYGENINWDKISQLSIDDKVSKRSINIPVCFNVENDWEAYTAKIRDQKIQIIKKLLAVEFNLAFRGFMPGFVYLNGLPKELYMDRKSNPQRINKGDVGIGGKYLGIYPQASPGGWNIIGNCPVSFLNLDKNCPLLVEPDDVILLEEINLKSHTAILAQKLNILDYNGITD